MDFFVLFYLYKNVFSDQQITDRRRSLEGKFIKREKVVVKEFFARCSMRENSEERK